MDLRRKGMGGGGSATGNIMASFFLAILAGSVLLALPISSADGRGAPYIDALFTATTSICVTGLVTLPTFSSWSIFGQAVILALIQLGGLGVITVLTGLMIVLHKRIGLGGRILIQDAFNLNTLSGLVKFIRKVLLGTLAVEGAGALLTMTVFVPEYGAKGVWFSVFHAVSAFCNAGMDIFSQDSLCRYAKNPIINLTTGVLIFLGGIGYIVWWDVLRVLKDIRRRGWKCFSNLTLHSKIALSWSGILLAAGAAAFFVLEYDNPLTLKGCSVPERIQIALFQSVTARTAGFVSVPQQNLTNASALVTMLLMFIGGSPVGTAGGVKTVTAAVLLASALAAIRNKPETALFHRSISKQTVGKAVAVVCTSFVIVFVSTVLLAAVTEADALDIVYETVSAAATVGLSRNLTPSLNLWGKLILILTMYLGRVGPISLLIVFHTRKKDREDRAVVKYPMEEISVG